MDGTNRCDTPYWQAVSEMEVPPTLRHRIELFRETGSVFHVPPELFGENSWIQVMMGQGVVPRQHHPVANVMTDAELSRFLDGFRDNVRATVAQLPAHMDYIRSYCPGES